VYILYNIVIIFYSRLVTQLVPLSSSGRRVCVRVRARAIHNIIAVIFLSESARRAGGSGCVLALRRGGALNFSKTIDRRLIIIIVLRHTLRADDNDDRKRGGPVVSERFFFVPLIKNKQNLGLYTSSCVVVV